MIQRKHRDLIQHMIQEAAHLIATLLGMDTEEAEQQLDTAFQEWTGLNRKDLEKLPDEEFKAKLGGAQGLEISTLELLAEIYTKEGFYYFNKKQFLKSKKKLERALWLFTEVDQNRKTFSFERQAQLQKIKTQIHTIESHYQNDNNINDDIR